MNRLVLYTRPGCHLCEEVEQQLADLQDRYPHTLEKINIDDNPTYQKQYMDKIPVLEVGPYKLSAPISKQQIEIALGAMKDIQQHNVEIEANRRAKRSDAPEIFTRADRFSYWLSRHYMAVFNIFFFLYFGLPFLAPMLMKAGIEGPARLIYYGYSPACHQLAFRSFFLFGEQSVYPRASAGLEGFLTYEQATGIPSDELDIARDFVGNEQLGYKTALCQRDVAIYFGIFAFGLVFSVIGRKWNSLHWTLWLFLGLLPIGLDGFSQLFSQLPFDWMQSLVPYRESTPFLRVLTGLLFGVMTAWFGYPAAETAMRETRDILALKLERIARQNQKR